MCRAWRGRGQRGGTYSSIGIRVRVPLLSYRYSRPAWHLASSENLSVVIPSQAVVVTVAVALSSSPVSCYRVFSSSGPSPWFGPYFSLASLPSRDWDAACLHRKRSLLALGQLDNSRDRHSSIAIACYRSTSLRVHHRYLRTCPSKVRGPQRNRSRALQLMSIAIPVPVLNTRVPVRTRVLIPVLEYVHVYRYGALLPVPGHVLQCILDR